LDRWIKAAGARTVWRNPQDRYYQNYNSSEQDASIAATTMMYEAEKGRGLECAKATALLENEIKPSKLGCPQFMDT